MAEDDPIDYSLLAQNVPETPEPTLADVTGEIPSWVHGTLLRNGPGIFEIGPDKYNHLFDGLALLQRYYVSNGQVYYSAKYLRSNSYNTDMASNRIIVSEFGTLGHLDPCKNIFNRYFSYYYPGDFTDNAVVNYLQCGDEIYAATETPKLIKIDRKTLDTLDTVDLKKIFAVNVTTAHPHYDETGNVYNMATGNTTYNIVKMPIPKDGGIESAKIIASIPMSSYMHPSYYHSFGMTQNHVVFPEMPLTLSVPKLLTSAIRNAPYSTSMEWDSERRTRIYLSNIHTKALVPLVYTSEGWFTFHHANAYEEDNCVIVDLCAYKDASIVLTALNLERFKKGKRLEADIQGYLKRFVLPLSVPEKAKPGDDLMKLHSVSTMAKAILQMDGSIHLESELLCEEAFDFPRYNYEMSNGRKYRFVYGCEVFNETSPSILKVDVSKKTYIAWGKDHKHQFPAEPVFVPRPGATEEDDGVVLVPITNIKKGDKPFLLFLDGKTMTEIARAHLTSKIPFAFHAHYVAE